MTLRPTIKRSSGMEKELLQELNKKVDRIAEQVAFISVQQQAWEELKKDAMPIVKDAYNVVVSELSQIDREFSIEDVWQLTRKLIRNTRTLTEMLDLLLSLHDLLNDFSPLSKQMVSSAIEGLRDMEQKGVFEVMKGLTRVADKILETHKPEDLERLADNIEIIMDTMKKVTQPELLEVVNNSVALVSKEQKSQPVGMFGMLKAIRDPEIQSGLGIMLEMLREISKTGNDK